MEIKFTKTKLLKEVNNDMCHNYYWLYYGRIYNDDQSCYKAFNFIVWFDIFDVMDYFGEEYVTKKMTKEYANELAWNTTSLINSFEDCKQFYSWCHKSIDDFNGE